MKHLTEDSIVLVYPIGKVALARQKSIIVTVPLARTAANVKQCWTLTSVIV